MVTAVVGRYLAGTSASSDAALLDTALATLRSATNWLEGSESFELAHKVLDQAGRARRVLFRRGCAFVFEDGAYHQRCPVALGHSRMGVSIGAIIEESECSVCGLDPEDCIHISGRYYQGQECVRVIKRFSLDHVAFVEQPDFPDARIMSFPVDIEDIRSILGEKFIPGMEVFCDRCLSSCDGVHRPMRRLVKETGS